MDERIARLEKLVDALEDAVSRLDRRLAVLERARSGAEMAADEPGAGAESSTSPREPWVEQWPLSVVRGTAALVGRSLLILAGAFLLRALTEAGSLGAGTGVALGLAYASSWIIAAAGAAHRGSRASAGFFAICTAMIADPLIFEAVTGFGVLSPAAGAVTLAAVTAAGLVVASRWKLPESAWVFVVGAMATGATLAVVRPPGGAAMTVVVLLGVAVVWLPGLSRWESLRWLTALGADIGVLGLTAMATAPGGPHEFPPPHTTVVAVLQAAVLFGFVGSSCVRAVRGRQSIRTFDFVQTAAAWAVGWGGAVQLARANDVGARGLAGFALVVGLAAYAAAFGIVDRSQGRNRAFVFLSTLGLALVLVGIPGAFGAAAPVAWAAVAVVAGAAGGRWDRVTLRVHSALLLVVAWVWSGGVGEIVADLGRSAVLDAAPGTVPILVAAATVLVTAVVLSTQRLASPGWVQRLPLTVLLLMSAMALAVAFVRVTTVVSPMSAQWMGTVALSMVTIMLAVVASRWGVQEAGWVVYPMLAVTGLRVVLADLATDRTVVLVIALAAYGAALILSPKLLRSQRRPARV